VLVRGFLAIFVLIAVSGCLSSNPESRHPASTTPIPGETYGNLQFDDCHGVRATQDIPTPVASAKPPREWSGSTLPMVKVAVNIVFCERINFGQFERGPITILTEVHDNYSAAGECMNGAFDSAWVLSQFWLDDQEIVSSLQALGMPAAVARFDWEIEEVVGGLEKWQITFSSDANAESELSVTEFGGNQSHFATVDRMFWENSAGGISLMDFGTDRSRNGENPVPIVQGKFESPFLFARFLGNPLVSARGQIDQTETITAPIQTFEDFLCEEPL
jgi:hypothetical protein